MHSQTKMSSLHSGFSKKERLTGTQVLCSIMHQSHAQAQTRWWWRRYNDLGREGPITALGLLKLKPCTRVATTPQRDVRGIGTIALPPFTISSKAGSPTERSTCCILYRGKAMDILPYAPWSSGIHCACMRQSGSYSFHSNIMATILNHRRPVWGNQADLMQRCLLKVMGRGFFKSVYYLICLIYLFNAQDSSLCGSWLNYVRAPRAWDGHLFRFHQSEE